MSEDKDVKPGLDLRNAPSRRGERLVVNEPKYPILKIDELPLGRDTPDLRGSLPRSVSNFLNDDLKVIDFKEHEHVWPRSRVSYLNVVMKAAKARRIDEIGLRGPTFSSISLEKGERSRYEMHHGRDLEHAGFDMDSIGRPSLAKTAAVYLAERQGVADEIYVPGHSFGQEKVGGVPLVEFDKQDAIAQKFERRLGWKPTYYGSADAPVTYINLLATLERDYPGFLNRTFYDSKEKGHPEEALTRAFDRSLHWALTTADEHQGLIAYKNPISGGGIRNQGWRDSDTAMVHKNGDWASDEFGIAPMEIQGILYDAYHNAARVKTEVYKDYPKAEGLRGRAWDLQKFIIQNGFVSTKDGGYFASGFDWGPDGRIRPLEVATTAMGRLLTSDILKSDDPDTQEMVRLTIQQLLSPEMLTRWGLRTLASDEAAYIPFLYHVGPIWKHDTNEVARGMSNHGYFGLDRIIGATTTHQHQATGVFYEHISGDDSEEPQVPNRDTYVYDQKHDVVYLFEQAPPPGQTWAATSEWAKHHRYAAMPLQAIDPVKLAFEKKMWRQLPDHIKQVVSIYEPDLAIALAA
jgi:hypothetical protein